VSTKLTFSTILDRLDTLESAVLGRIRRRLSKPELARREGVSTRTIDRRVRDGLLPPPDVVARRLYWWLDEVERHQHERSATATSKAARDPRQRKPAQAEAP
jgi:predicted DNA-binding transcriptional regulator AlpA